MRFFHFLLPVFSFYSAMASAAIPLSYPRAQNFLLSGAEGVGDWLIPMPPAAPYRGKLNLIFSRQSDVWGLYQDIKTKDQTKISQRLSDSYGNLYDAAAKIGISARFGAFTQGLSINAAASMLVNDPVFPEISGLLYNNYVLFSSYDISAWGFTFKPSLVYGLRRVMDRSFTVGQLVDTKPDVKLKSLPYRAFVEAGLEATRPTPWGDILLNAKGLPLYRYDYAYWQVETGFRSKNLLAGVKRTWPWRVNTWVTFAPIYGGAYALVRTVKLGASVEWFRYLQTDVFVMDKFRPAILVRLGTAAWNVQAFSFARSEDDFKAFNSRQYGLALQGSF